MIIIGSKRLVPRETKTGMHGENLQKYSANALKKRKLQEKLGK